MVNNLLSYSKLDTPLRVFIPADINRDVYGYNMLCYFFEQLRKSQEVIIILDFSRVRWIEATLCSFIGAQLERLRKQSGKIFQIININSRVSSILSRNGFLAECFPGTELKNLSPTGTEIKYKSFALHDEYIFYEHLVSLFSPRRDLRIRESTKDSLITNLLEVFANSSMHSESRPGIFACGQLFPQRQELAYNVSDCGTGLYNKVKLSHPNILYDYEAIDWALQQGNTTKPTNVTGGLGLANLDQFAANYGGRIEIVTGRAVYLRQGKKVEYNSIGSPYYGTSVTLSINLKGDKTYLEL